MRKRILTGKVYEVRNCCIGINILFMTSVITEEIKLWQKEPDVCEAMIWYDMMRYDKIYMMTWYDIWYVVWYGVWYDMIWYNVTWYDKMYDMIYDTIWWHDIWYIWHMIYVMLWYMIYYMIWYDMICYDMIYDKIYDIIYLTAIRLPPGGSSTVHIYTQNNT
jgi:hypothetical protein